MTQILSTQKDRSFRNLLLAVAIEPQEIGRRIRVARLRRGWTQVVLSQEANVSSSSVQRWESGIMPPVRELIRLAGVLGIDPEQLVELEPSGEERLLGRLESLEATVAREGQAMTSGLEGVAERLERIEQLLAPPAARAKRDRKATKR